MKISGKNLIFLISQPRSGSSLMQQLLNSHPAVISLPEPWLMLPLIFTYKYPGIDSVYNSEFANICLMDYLGQFADGSDVYLGNIRELALEIYGLALRKDKKAIYFLDKTPRYYHIIDELVEIFYDAKFILLSRNPAAVFASILDYSFRGDHVSMLAARDRCEDIFSGPLKIAQAREKYGDLLFYLNYEDLVTDPKRMMSGLYSYLELDELEDLTRYHLAEDFKDTTSIDTKSVHQHDRPVENYIDSWKNSIDTGQKKILIMDYMKTLPEKAVTGLGYSRENILSELKDHPVIPSLKPKPLQHFLARGAPYGSHGGIIRKSWNRLIKPLHRSLRHLTER